MKMKCEHGISIYEDCIACNAEYDRQNHTWETKMIRRELGSIDARIVSLQREREAERRARRILHDALLEALPILNEGAASGMVPFASCKAVYAKVCEVLEVEPQP
jgi:hypothetical protein